MPCSARWDGWIWPPGWLGGEVVAKVQHIISHPGESHARKHPVRDTGGVGQGDTAGPRGRWDPSRLRTAMARCHQDRSLVSYGVQPQTGREDLVLGAGRMLRSLDLALLFPKQPAPSGPALADAASLQELPKKVHPDSLS